MRELARVTAEAAAERKRVARWLAEHPGEGSLPGWRQPSGESRYPEHSTILARVAYDKRPNGRVTFPLPEDIHGPGAPSNAMSYNVFEQEDAIATDRGLAWLEKVTGMDMLSGYGPRSDAQVELAARVDNALTFLTNDQYELLHERFWLDGGRTLQQMADDRNVTRQAMHQRMRRVLAAFARVWRVHAEDDISWEVET